MARYPVTVGQYRQFVEDDGYKDMRWWEAGGFGEFSEPDDWEDQQQYPSRPVVNVSWWEAAAYCAWAGYRLPTEAEWERAARGTEGRKYPWGDEPPKPARVNYDGSRIGHPTPVGIFPWDVTPDGICDLAGNVWEWCADWEGKYAARSVQNPRGPKKAAPRVFRGGCWAGDAEYCRSACPHAARAGGPLRVPGLSRGRSSARRAVQVQVRPRSLERRPKGDVRSERSRSPFVPERKAERGRGTDAHEIHVGRFATQEFNANGVASHSPGLPYWLPWVLSREFLLYPNGVASWTDPDATEPRWGTELMHRRIPG